MDWKLEAIEKLQGYEAHREALERIPLELECLDAEYTGIHGARIDGAPVRGGSGSTREDAMLRNIARRDDLKLRLKISRLWVEIVDHGLSILTEEERIVLEYCYIHRRKGFIEDLCFRLCMEKATVYRRRDISLRRFTLALYGAIESL